ncbi:MAG: HAD family hydrolase, partial [Anaerolineae bacterium]|nr:HAD family hydrolase [Anaerolineae bacterium]
MTIKAITFDFWATLYRPRSIDLEARLLDLKNSLEGFSGTTFSLEQVKLAADTARETWSETWVQGHRTLNAGEWLDIMMSNLGTSLAPEHHRELRLSMENGVLELPPTLVPEAASALEALAGDYRLAIISDTGISPGRALRAILEQDDILQYFSHLTFSDEIGRSKPHPNAFLTTLKALNATPAEAVHIGDLLRTDIAGGQGVGMRTVQYIGVSQDEWLDSTTAPPIPDAII